MEKNHNEKRVAWGITGSGHKLLDVLSIMKIIKDKYHNEVRITVYLSKAGELVLKYYQKLNEIKKEFEKIRIEVNSNIPTLAVQLQSGKIDFLLIAPATSNTVAKIANGIADTLLTNAAIMALKVSVPVYILPCDFKEGETTTSLPDGSEMKIYVRKEDAAYVTELNSIKGLFLLEKTQEIYSIFEKFFSI